jgi:hypothetical protein
MKQPAEVGRFRGTTEDREWRPYYLDNPLNATLLATFEG